MSDLSLQDQSTEFLLYTAPNGQVKVEVLLSGETIWLTQKRMAELFGVGVPAISKHLKKIFESGELQEELVVSILENTTEHGAVAGLTQTQQVKYYNLDAVISVGYRVNSAQATQFRIWATQLIKEYIIKGFAMDDERLKNGRFFGKDYFRELLERVRSIRASERRVYQQITDIFAECSIDYDPKAETTRLFYAHIQDKFHFAITGHTAAEIIALKADASKPLMGMSTQPALFTTPPTAAQPCTASGAFRSVAHPHRTGEYASGALGHETPQPQCLAAPRDGGVVNKAGYKNAPEGRVLKSDANVAKNYLSEAEINRLERSVSAFFDYIEGIIERRNTFTMESFAESVDKFLAFNEYRILEGHGSVSRKQADQKAFAEYDKFNKQQPIESDFDREVKKLLKKGEAGND